MKRACEVVPHVLARGPEAHYLQHLRMVPFDFHGRYLAADLGMEKNRGSS